ncbi:MotA/TolQ/ExbB proton channel family protein [Bermanella sp. R86510]|uniref:MotA/TolQ/ExbB proton channel family protein n=1 Tax=unclassified Bermanella TaxID=2627862 RepID=UPI0037CAF065
MLTSVSDFLQSGGPVLYGILGVSLLLWFLILDRYWFFKVQAKPLCRSYRDEWARQIPDNKWCKESIRNLYISNVRMAFEKHSSTVALLVMVCPLMGLLGTVTGMISVFDTMAVTGTGNARAMASGISMATVPTMAGMVVSLIGLYFKTRFNSMAKKQLEIFKDKLHN